MLFCSNIQQYSSVLPDHQIKAKRGQKCLSHESKVTEQTESNDGKTGDKREYIQVTTSCARKETVPPGECGAVTAF